MTHPGAARPGEPGWQHHPEVAAQPAPQLPPEQWGAPGQQAGGPAGPAGPVNPAASGPGHAWAAQRGQGRAATSTVYGARAAAAVPPNPTAPANHGGQHAYPAAAPTQPHPVAQSNPAAPVNTAAWASTARQSAAVAPAAPPPATPPPRAAPASSTTSTTVAGPPPKPDSPGAPRVRLYRPPLGIGPVTVVQLVAWQVGVVAILAATQHSVLLTAVVAAVAVLVLAPTVIRIHGRWLHQWSVVWWAFRRRRRQFAAGDPEPARDLLARLARGVELESVEIDDQPAVLLTHPAGLSVVFDIDPTEGALLMSTPQALPSPAVLLPPADRKGPPVVVQLLIQVTPAPRAHPSAAAVGRAYRELTNGDVPASRQAWVVLQVARTPDFHADHDLLPTLTKVIQRTRRLLRQERVTARMLNRDEVLATVATLTHLTGAMPGAGSEQLLARESWRAWSTGGARQSCHRLLNWPSQRWEIDPLLRGLPSAGGVVSIAATRVDGDNLAMEAAFRLLGSGPDGLAAADEALHQAIRRHGGQLQRLDGEHAHGVAATLPLGGFLR